MKIILSGVVILTFVVVNLMVSGRAQAEEKIVISEKDCARALRAERVKSAEYVPGVDVRGRKVKGANLDDSGQIKIPDELSFEISPNIYTMIGIPPPKGLEDTTVTVGTIKVSKRGAITFNGKRLNRRTAKEIVELCKAQMAEKQ